MAATGIDTTNPTTADIVSLFLEDGFKQCATNTPVFREKFVEGVSILKSEYKVRGDDDQLKPFKPAIRQLVNSVEPLEVFSLEIPDGELPTRLNGLVTSHYNLRLDITFQQLIGTVLLLAVRVACHSVSVGRAYRVNMVIDWCLQFFDQVLPPCGHSLNNWIEHNGGWAEVLPLNAQHQIATTPSNAAAPRVNAPNIATATRNDAAPASNAAAASNVVPRITAAPPPSASAAPPNDADAFSNRAPRVVVIQVKAASNSVDAQRDL